MTQANHLPFTQPVFTRVHDLVRMEFKIGPDARQVTYAIDLMFTAEEATVLAIKMLQTARSTIAENPLPMDWLKDYALA